MKAPLKKFHNKQPIKSPKATINFTQVNNLIYSYSLKNALPNLDLFQQETNLSLSMQIKAIDETLQVTTFTLTPNTLLMELSPDLHDAALLEIILQALILLFDHAQQKKAAEISFILSPEDAIHLACFEGFFDEVAFFPTHEGSKTSLTVYNSKETREFLFKTVNSMLLQVKQELWKAQKYDSHVKKYLQNKKISLPSAILDQNQGRSKDNVIAFLSS